MPSKALRVQRIEEVIQQDVGRNATALFNATKGNLFKAASSLAAAGDPALAVLTGFFVPSGKPPSGETDGPVGAALLIKGLEQAGVRCCVATDAYSGPTCAAALEAAKTGARLDIVGTADEVARQAELWRREGVTHVLSTERAGRSADGRPRNMRGIDISSHHLLLDDLFCDGPWTTIAIGDGGNEIGMGSIARDIIAGSIRHGALIACTTPADYLIAAGVSDWGAIGLVGALAVLKRRWRGALLEALDGETYGRILEQTVKNGPAVDGVTGARSLSIDGLALQLHVAKIGAIREIVEGAGAGVYPSGEHGRVRQY